MEGTFLPNIAWQYAARADRAIEILEGEDRDEGIRLLEEIAGEPFVPVWFIMAVNMKLFWNKEMSKAPPHFLIARQAHAELERRWPPHAMSESTRWEFAKFTSMIQDLQAEFPFLRATNLAELHVLAAAAGFALSTGEDEGAEDTDEGSLESEEASDTGSAIGSLDLNTLTPPALPPRSPSQEPGEYQASSRLDGVTTPRTPYSNG